MVIAISQNDIRWTSMVHKVLCGTLLDEYLIVHLLIKFRDCCV